VGWGVGLVIGSRVSGEGIDWSGLRAGGRGNRLG
jgi:hypothetical protein